MSEAKTDPNAAASEQQKKPVVRRLLQKNFGLNVGGFRYNEWWVDLEEQETLADALNPAFYANIADKIMGNDPAKPRGIGDLVEIRKPGTALYAKMIVTGVGKGFVKAELIEKPYEPEEAELPEDSRLITRWNPGKRCHEVLRAQDKQFMQGGFQSKAEAIAWIEDHLKKLAA